MSSPNTEHKITWSLVWATLVSCMSTLQFGFHLAVFNAPQAILSCHKSIPGPFPSYADTFWGHLNLDQCIRMGPTSTAYINTMFTLGGLISSTIVGFRTVNGNFGRKHLQKISAFTFFLGSALISISKNVFCLESGRLLTGFAAGSSMVTAPILVSELTPYNHRGLMGSLLQFGVAIGILFAQLIAFLWSNDQQWRNLFVAGAFLGLLQFALMFTTVESPKWLIMERGDVSGASEILHSVRTNKSATRHEINHYRSLSSVEPSRNSETAHLLKSQGEIASSPFVDTIGADPQPEPATSSFANYVSQAKYRKEWIAVTIIMTAQQLCGMNAITFYGVSVLSNVVPASTNVLILTSSLALTNVVSALAVSPFIDKWGRKPFLLLSVGCMATCSVVISAGLIQQKDAIAALGCFGFVVAYSIGLGQIPFLMVSELSSSEAVGVAQSFGTSLNWMANICVAFMFPILQELLHGWVFFVFFVLGVFYFGAISWYVPETRGKAEYHEIWHDFVS
ncbi:hypothetical protein OXX69_008644 [Metschnikowia pulcherrima]